MQIKASSLSLGVSFLTSFFGLKDDFEMSIELSEFYPSTIKQASNMRMHESQIHIINHDHFIIVTWLSTHIIVRGSKRSNFRKGTLKLKIQFLVLMKDFTKQLILVVKNIFKFSDSQRKTLGG
jgi:hypothetical protein